MTQQLTLDATPTTQDEHKVQGRLLALGFFIARCSAFPNVGRHTKRAQLSTRTAFYLR